MMLRFVLAVLTVCAPAQAFQQEDDIYVIYSLMLTDPKTSHGPDDNERYLIARATAPAHPPEPCVRPPAEREAEFREAVSDYQRRKTIPRQLSETFSIAKSYALLSASEVEEFKQARKYGRGNSDRFPGVSDLFILSDVYFSQRGTLALTGVSTFCNVLCGSYQWKVFEKVEGQWEERLWPARITIATSPVLAPRG